MRQALTAAGITLLILSAAHAAQADPASRSLSAQPSSVLGSNLLQNGGFETNDGTNAAGWQAQDYSNRTICAAAGTPCGNPYVMHIGAASTYPLVALDTSTAHTGSASVQMKLTSGGAEPMLVTPISILGARTYTVSFWVRTVGPSTGMVRDRVAYYRDSQADTWTFPNDGAWHQVTGSDFVPQSQTNVLFGVRSGVADQPVWFDDVSVQALPFNVFTVSAGDQHLGPNSATFRVHAVADVPSGLTFQLNVLDPSGQTTSQSVTLPAIAAGTDYPVSIPYSAPQPGRYHLDPSVLDGGQTVWHVVPAGQHATDPATPDASNEGFPTLDLVMQNTFTTTLVEPHYRRAIYQTDPLTSVTVQGQLTLPGGGSLAGYTYGSQLRAADGTVLATTPPATPSAPSFSVSYPTTLLPPVGPPPSGQLYAADGYSVVITVTDPQGHTFTSRESFRKMGPSPDGVEVARDAGQVIRVDGTPYFPRGLYDAADLRSLKQGSFNFAIASTFPPVGSTTYQTETSLGVRRILTLTANADGACKLDYKEPVTCLDVYLAAKIASVQNDPEIIGFAYGDEYDYDRYARHAYDYLVQNDPYRIMYESDYEPYNYRNAWRAADVVAVDPYPIYATQPRSVLEVGSKLDEARQGSGGQAAIWDIPQVMGSLPWFTPPTAGQLRAMVYLGLLHGATGLVGYDGYAYNFWQMPATCKPRSPSEIVGDKMWGLHWYLWCTPLASVYIKLTTEAVSLFPILTQGVDVTSSWTMTPASPTRLEWTARSINGHTYVIVQNTDSKGAQATFTPPAQSRFRLHSSRALRDLISKRVWTTAATGFTASFSGYQTRVFTF